jgi:hypothetical protein
MSVATLPEIRRPEAVDADWMTRALQSAGIDAVVAGLEAKAVGTGQIGDSVRFRLRYARGGDGAPVSLVGKFPSANPVSRERGVTNGHYAREINFYRHLAATAGVATPRWYLAEFDEATGEFVLLMEDLAPAEQGDQLAGVTPAQAQVVMDEAAKLHASHWGDDALDEFSWLLGSRASGSRLTGPATMQAAWDAFRERYAERLAPQAVDVGRYFVERNARFHELGEGPHSLCHNDFRPDNMMFATPAGGRPLTVLDWQSVSYSSGPTDVGYFLAGALPPDVRRANEAALLGRYHGGLLAGGVKGYDLRALQRDYAIGGMRLLMVAILASVGVRQTARGDTMFMQMTHAAVGHIQDTGALDLLD